MAKKIGTQDSSIKFLNMKHPWQGNLEHKTMMKKRPVPDSYRD